MFKQSLNKIIAFFFLSISLIALPCFAQAQSSHVIDLEWEAMDSASQYELELTPLANNGNKGKSIKHLTQDTAWQPRISAGRYQLRIRAFDSRGVPGAWSEANELSVHLPAPSPNQPKEKARIVAKNDDDEKLLFSWQPVPGSNEYEILVKSIDEKFSDSWKVSETNKEIKLPVGKDYRYQIRALDKNDFSSQDEPWIPFSLLGPNLAKPTPVKPISNIVEKLEWSKVDKAESYRYDLLRQIKGKKWTVVKKQAEIKDNDVEFDLKNPSGIYMLRVSAHANNRGPSKKASMTFETRGGFRTPAAKEAAVLQESLAKPTHFYGIGSYFIAQAKYEGLNKERSGQKAAFNGLTGTGRVGLGYQLPRKNWGVYGVADVGGILVNGQNNTFTSIEGHGTWKTFLFGANQFVFSGGPYMIQLPEIVGNQIEGLKSFDKITNMGLHGGFKYWRPFSEKYGMQINTRVYLPVTGKSPTGTPIESLMSYQFGVLGSYRYSRNILALAGYAYRLNQAGYQARTFAEINEGFADPGDINVIRMQGHYLNLILEYSF